MARLPFGQNELLGNQGLPKPAGTGGGGQGVATAAGGSQVGGVPAPRQGPPMPTGAQGTGFINIQQLLDANAGGGKAMADALTGKANKLGGDATGEFNRDQGQANASYNDAYSKAQGDYNSQMASYNQQMKDYEARMATIRSNPFAGAADVVKNGQPVKPGAAPTFQAPGAPTISGTVGGQEFGSLQGALGKASGFADRLTSQQGRAADLQDMYGKGPSGQYTSGMASLDTLLSGAAPGAQEAYKGAQAQYGSGFGGLGSMMGFDAVSGAPAASIPGAGTNSAPVGSGAGGIGGTPRSGQPTYAAPPTSPPPLPGQAYKPKKGPGDRDPWGNL